MLVRGQVDLWLPATEAGDSARPKAAHDLRRAAVIPVVARNSRASADADDRPTECAAVSSVTPEPRRSTVAVAIRALALHCPTDNDVSLRNCRFSVAGDRWTASARNATVLVDVRSSRRSFAAARAPAEVGNGGRVIPPDVVADGPVSHR